MAKKKNTFDPDLHFSPNEFLGSRMSESNRAKAKHRTEAMISKLSTKLGREATFEDFIESLIKQFGEEAVDKEFNAFAYFYELTERQIEDSVDNIYNKVFSIQSNAEILLGLAQQKPEEVVKEQDKKEPAHKTETKHFKVVEADLLNSHQSEDSSHKVKEYAQRDSEEIPLINSKKITGMPLFKYKKFVNNLFHRILTNLTITDQDKINLAEVTEQLKDNDTEVDVIEDSVDEEIIEQVSEDLSNEKSEEDLYGKSSFVKDHRLNFSQGVKIFFSGIPKINRKTGKPFTTFLHLADYYSIEEAEREFMEILAFSKSSEKDVLEALEAKSEIKPIYKVLFKKFKEAPQDIRNAILYNMVKHPLEMQSIIYTEANENSYAKMLVINANSNNSIVRLLTRWTNNFLASKAYIPYGNTKILDVEYMAQLIEDINYIEKNMATTDVKKEFKKVFYDLGLDLEDNVLDIIYHNKDLSVAPQFSAWGVLRIMRNNIWHIIDDNNNEGVSRLDITNEFSNPQKNARAAIRKIANLSNKINGNAISKSFRVAGKIVQGTTQRTALSETLVQLKDPKSPMVTALSKIPYSRNNYILEMLRKDEDFRNLYNASYTSLQVLKNDLTKRANKKKISKLSINDSEIAQLAYFTQTITKLNKPFSDSKENESTLDFRLTYSYIPTISDKDKMVLIHTPVISLGTGYYRIDPTTKKINLFDEVLDFITTQIYSSEFDRIVTVMNNPTNIVNFDPAGALFLSIPALNYMTDESGNNILDLLEANKDDMNAIMKLKAKFYKEAHKTIAEYIDFEVKSKIDLTSNTGSFFENGILEVQDNGEYALNFVDGLYLKESSLSNDDRTNVFIQAQFLATEFVISYCCPIKIYS